MSASPAARRSSARGQASSTIRRSSRLVTLPQRSQTTCGGGPCLSRSFAKSSSFVTTATGPADARAASKISVSRARCSPSSSMERVGPVLCLKPSRQCRWKLCVDPGRARGTGRPSSRDVGHGRLCCQDRVIELTGRVEQAGGNIVGFEIRIVREDVLRRLSGGEKLEHVDDADPNPTNAGASPALFRIDRDSGQQLGFAHWGHSRSASRPGPKNIAFPWARSGRRRSIGGTV
jgi:hypothetical protein